MKKSKKLLSILFAFVILLSLMPTAVLAADRFSDTSGHWAKSAIETWAGHEVLSGYPGGHFRPDLPITRAELAVVLGHVMGYATTTDAVFTDLPAGEWYAEDIAKLYAAGIMLGDGGGIMRPTANITREEAAVMIARAFSVSENAGNENPFPDAENISGWASFLVDGMKAAGYINGDQNGNFNPKVPITRAEIAAMLDNIVELFVNAPGEYDAFYTSSVNQDSDGVSYQLSHRNVVVRSTGVTLKNHHITGNLYITEGVADGDVTLENCTVGGTMYVSGGGENSVHIIGGRFGDIVLDSSINTHVELSAETAISHGYIVDTGSITHRGMTVTYSPATDTLALGGNIDVVELNADGTVTLTAGGVVYDVIPTEGTVANFALAPGSMVKKMTTNGPVEIGGAGKIEQFTVHEDGVVIDKSVNVRPQDIAVDDGAKITVADKEYTGTGKPLPPNETPSSNSSGGSTPTPTTYTVAVALMDNTGGTLLQTSFTGESITENNLENLVNIDPGYVIAGYYTTNNPAGTPVTFPITANTTVYIRLNGDGSPSAPIGIATEAELDAVRSDLAKNYRIVADISLTGDWTPIGVYDTAPFVGSLDGGGYTVTINSINAPSTGIICVGMFGYISTGGRVSNVAVAGTMNVTSASTRAMYLGGIVGFNEGTIENCYSSVAVTATRTTDNAAAGGIVGFNDAGTVKNCYATGDVTANAGSSHDADAGGIVGYSRSGGTISNCYATGAISASGNNYTGAGGIVGEDFYGTTAINQCVALNASISIGGSTYIGRIWGQDDGIANGAGNRAVEISSLPLGAATDKNGETINAADALTAAFWSDTADGIWKDIIGTGGAKPWVADDGELPYLHWQSGRP